MVKKVTQATCSSEASSPETSSESLSLSPQRSESSTLLAFEATLSPCLERNHSLDSTSTVSLVDTLPVLGAIAKEPKEHLFSKDNGELNDMVTSISSPPLPYDEKHPDKGRESDAAASVESMSLDPDDSSSTWSFASAAGSESKDLSELDWHSSSSQDKSLTMTPEENQNSAEHQDKSSQSKRATIFMDQIKDSFRSGSILVSERLYYREKRIIAHQKHVSSLLKFLDDETENEASKSRASASPPLNQRASHDEPFKPVPPRPVIITKSYGEERKRHPLLAIWPQLADTFFNPTDIWSKAGKGTTNIWAHKTSRYVVPVAPSSSLPNLNTEHKNLTSTSHFSPTLEGGKFKKFFSEYKPMAPLTLLTDPNFPTKFGAPFDDTNVQTGFARYSNTGNDNKALGSTYYTKPKQSISEAFEEFKKSFPSSSENLNANTTNTGSAGILNETNDNRIFSPNVNSSSSASESPILRSYREALEKRRLTESANVDIWNASSSNLSPGFSEHWPQTANQQQSDGSGLLQNNGEINLYPSYPNMPSFSPAQFANPLLSSSINFANNNHPASYVYGEPYQVQAQQPYPQYNTQNYQAGNAIGNQNVLVRRQASNGSSTQERSVEIPPYLDRYFSVDRFSRNGIIDFSKIHLETSSFRDALTRIIDPAYKSLHLVQFKGSRSDVFYLQESSELELRYGDLVIVDADRGRDLGKVCRVNLTREQAGWIKWRQYVDQQAALQKNPYDPRSSSNCNDRRSLGNGSRIKPSIEDLSVVTPKKIIQYAKSSDLNSFAMKQSGEERAIRFCTKKVLERSLNMRVIDAEYQWDLRKMTIFYSAKYRIDFRDLITDMFRFYKTRIWMCATNIGPPKTDHSEDVSETNLDKNDTRLSSSNGIGEGQYNASGYHNHHFYNGLMNNNLSEMNLDSAYANNNGSPSVLGSDSMTSLTTAAAGAANGNLSFIPSGFYGLTEGSAANNQNLNVSQLATSNEWNFWPNSSNTMSHVAQPESNYRYGPSTSHSMSSFSAMNNDAY